MTTTLMLLSWLGVVASVNRVVITRMAQPPLTLLVLLHMVIVTLIGAVAVSVTMQRADH